MRYRKLLILIALVAAAPLLLRGQNLSAPYPQRNALDYLLYWGDSTRNNYTGKLSHWGSRFTLSVGGGAEYQANRRAVGTTVFSPFTRVQLGWWFTPVSAVELGGSFGVIPPTEHSGYGLSRAGELNYLFNFSKFASRNAGYERFSLLGLLGMQVAFPQRESENRNSWGAHAALRGVYHLRRGMNLFIEPRLSYYDGSRIGGSESADRGYTLASSLAFGMQVRLKNVDRYQGQWLGNTQSEYQKMSYALKTNLLYGGLTYTPNLGVEFMLSPRFTLEAMVGVNPFKADKREPVGRSLKHSLYQLSGRYWFERSFNGAFVSLHSTYAAYDLSGYALPWLFGQKRSDVAYRGNAYGGGLSVGYLWRLNQHLGIEAELGAGYLAMNYERYDHSAGRLSRDLTRDYFGPTKASLSMVYLFNVGKVDLRSLNFFPALFAKRDDLLSFDIALKTNLLYGAVAFTPNLGVELALSEHMTLDMGAGYNPWGVNKGGDRKLVHTMYQAGPRYWTRGRFDGFFAGAHLLYSDYNISHHFLPMLFGSGSSYYRFQGNGYGAGFSVGYLWRVGKRLGIEAEVGGGYVRMKYDKYDCVNCGRAIEKGVRKEYYGPTKAALSLVYMLK